MPEKIPDHGGDIWGAARRLGLDPSEILDLSASLNPLGQPAGLAEEMAAAIPLMCHYPDRTNAELRAAMAGHLGVAPESVLPGNGSTALIRLLGRAFDLRTIVVLAPAFSEFGRSLAIAGRPFQYYLLSEQNAFAPVMSDLEGIWNMEPSCVIFSNPLTPSGGLVDSQILDLLLSQSESRRAWLVVDEAFIDFAPGEAREWAIPKLDMHRKLIVLRSLTKFYCLAGLRLGYMLGHPSTLAALAPLGEPWSVNTLAQRAGIFCLGQSKYAEKSRQAVKKWRDEQAARLRELGLFVFEGQANYLLIRLPADGPTAAQVSAACAAQGVLLRDCSNFPGCTAYHLRIAVAPPEEQDRLFEALIPALEAEAS